MHLPAGLQAFLTDDTLGGDAAELACQELFIEEQVLGHATSRFVKEGGVHFSGVRSYAITPANLEAMAVQQRGLGEVQLELLKFWFMIDPLPPARSYASVSVRITLRPPVRPSCSSRTWRRPIRTWSRRPPPSSAWRLPACCGCT